jgi:SAM-dependent methyltransferase
MESRFWEEQEQVERFAGRDPDHRLVGLIATYAEPANTRVLDLGCAGGRNTVLLAERGFDVFAIDASAAMVQRTRQRLAAILGEEEAEKRVLRTAMQDLSAFDDDEFDLVVALGIFHAATSAQEWHESLTQAVRVLEPGGAMLVSVFSRETTWTGEPIAPVPGAPHLYEGPHSGRHYFVDAEELDADMQQHGLETVTPTETVVVPVESGQRVTINAHYRKR